MVRRNKGKEKEIFFPEQRWLRQEWETQSDIPVPAVFPQPHSCPPHSASELLQALSPVLQCTCSPQKYKISLVSLDSSAVTKCKPWTRR